MKLGDGPVIVSGKFGDGPAIAVSKIGDGGLEAFALGDGLMFEKLGDGPVPK